MIGWLSSRKCALACLLGDESQHPIFPQVMHMRRCTQRLPVFKHSTQPGMISGTSMISILSRWLQIEAMSYSFRRSVNRTATAPTSSESDTELCEPAEDEGGDHRTLADCRRHSLHRAVPHVSRREDADAARLEWKRVAIERP